MTGSPRNKHPIRDDQSSVLGAELVGNEDDRFASGRRKKDMMEFPLKGARGIFMPDQVKRMQLRMEEEAIPDESTRERKERATRILQDEEISMGIASGWF